MNKYRKVNSTNERFFRRNVNDFVMVFGHGELVEGVEPMFRQLLNRKGVKTFSTVGNTVGNLFLLKSYLK